jgi:hypothetical protein
MTKLLENITDWFKSAKQSDLESFINSKRPTNAAEIDYWTREYEFRNQKSNAEVWGRGL